MMMNTKKNTIKTNNEPIKQSPIEFEGYYYQGCAGDLQYLIVLKTKDNKYSDSELISNSKFLLGFRTKLTIKLIARRLLKEMGKQKHNYTVYFDFNFVKH